MSRIQDILSKAERDGTARRTRALSDEYASRPADESMQARGFVDSAPAPRSLNDESWQRPQSPEPPRVAPPAPAARVTPAIAEPSRQPAPPPGEAFPAAVADGAVHPAEHLKGADGDPLS